MAIDSNLGAVVGAEEGAIESILGNEGRIAQAWVNVRGSLRVFSVYFWHPERHGPRRFRKKPFVSKRANVRDGTLRRVNVQIKKCQRRMG